MTQNIQMTDELIARYVDNLVTPQERLVVIDYLRNHPSEMEQVLFLMDVVSMTDEVAEKEFRRLQMPQRSNSHSDIALSSAAFVAHPNDAGKATNKESVKRPETGQLLSRLDSLLNELEQ